MPIRIKRHCYDKFWRCPGWAGGGWKYPHKDDKKICEGGSLPINWVRWPTWIIMLQFHYHKECGTIAIPHVTRWIDPSYIWYKLKG